MSNSSYTYTHKCVQGSNPPCTSACPINFNIRNFMSKLKKGNFNAAYREYAKQVIFPGIVCLICNEPCFNICPEAISMLKLEGGAVAHAVKKDPINFNLPAKNERVAIIGGGLSGMACAHRLATRRYKVTVFECNESLGGSLREIIDESLLDEEFNLQFKFLDYILKTNHEIRSLDNLHFDAVYIASGKGGKDFGLMEGRDLNSLATTRKGVFLGGKITGATDMEALMHGMVAAASIEKYIKVGRMDGQPETFLDTENKIPIKPGKNGKTIVPANGKSYNKEEAVKEAKRCVLCDCTECKDRCEFLQHMDLLPRKVESDANMANSADSGLFERVGTRMIASCSVCGHCGAVCPKDINVEDILIESKKMLYENGHFPPPLHDFYIRDFYHASNEAYLSKAPTSSKTAEYMFFPGCQMTASGTDHVEKAYKYMLDKYPDTALMLGCCGVPALWAGNHSLMHQVLNKIKDDWERLGRPTIVTACATCAKTFDTYSPEFKQVSLYEFIDKHGLPEDASSLEGQQAVFDPCSSRKFPDMQEAVRNISRKLGAELTELRDSRHEARCCGMGGHIYPANPNIFHKMLSASVNESVLPYITYCTNCRNLFISAGKECSHILDGVFNVEPLTKPFHISELRKNRLVLKQKLLKNIWGEAFEIMEKKYSVKLEISEEVYDKMDRLHISREDVYEVADYCEKNNETVLDTKTKIFTGHLQLGVITYWIQYKKTENNLEIVNVYSHRIQIS